MFFVCMKRKTVLYWTLGVLGTIMLCLGVMALGKIEPVNATKDEKVSDLSDIIVKIGEYGYQVDKSPAEIEQVNIPEKFNDVYKNYNEMQKCQGFDLEKYKGKIAKRYCFKITNYKDVVKDNKCNFDEVYINILVCKNKIIAGEVFSKNIDGFMHTFDGKNYYRAQTTSENTKE